MYYFWFTLWVWILTSLSVPAGELLTVNDIQSVMKQIFEQHVDQKEISKKSIKSAFKVYIDKFDPDRIYLLEEEVKPYYQLTDTQLEKIAADYKRDKFTTFEELNTTIQNAILRSRLLRKEIEKTPTQLFSIAALSSNEGDPDLKKPFPSNKESLKRNIQDYLVKFINAEKQHFGVNVVMLNQAQTLAIFDKGMEERENSYLYRNSNGTSLTKAEQENLFTIHVLKALASSLDAHTTFYDETEASDLKMRLQKEFQGVGIIFQQNIDGSVLVSDLSEGGPAARSGLVKIGDSVLAINDISIAGMPFPNVMEMIRTNKGSKNADLQLTLKRKNSGEIVKVLLRKQEISVKGERAIANYKTLNNGIIGIIKLDSFYQNSNGITSEHDILAALEKFQKIGQLRGLILDLRENSGGFLNQAVKVAGLFITNGVIVVSKYFNGEEHYYRDLDGKTYYTGPFVILTSRATASAAEIVAQALQDYGVAVIVGDETTYGKGTIQNQNVTEDNPKAASLFKVTVGKYYTVSGKTPQLQGVKADLVVPGIFNFEHLGEQYLEFTVQNDTIQNEYTDDLADVTPNLKAWYQHYYVPTLQLKDQQWQTMLPILRERSANRLTRNQDYQGFLKSARAGNAINYLKSKSKGSKLIDYQLDEGILIVEDMIRLQLQERSRPIINEKSIAEKTSMSYD